MSSSNSPCAACKCLRRKCTQECVFAPYFPPDNPQKFTNVHKVFGASNVSKILNELNAGQREDAVNSLAYEAEFRLRDPIYGCVGLISALQHKLRVVQHDLENAKKELATYIGPSAMMPILNHHSTGFVQPSYVPSTYQVMQYNQNVQPMMGIPHGSQLMIREPQQQQQHQQQFLEAQQEMLRSYEQQPNHELIRFNGGFEDGGGVTATGFNQQQQQPTLALESSYEEAIPYQHIQQQQQEQNSQLQSNHLHFQQEQLQQQEIFLQQNVPLQQPLINKEEERSIGPSC